MGKLFDDDEDKSLLTDEEIVEDEEILMVGEVRQKLTSDARRRLENLLEEKRLRDELEDFLD